MDKDGQIIEQVTFAQPNLKSDYVRMESGLREPRESINMDEGIVLSLAKVPEKVKCIVFLLKVPEVQRFKAEQQLKKIKYSAYGIEFW